MASLDVKGAGEFAVADVTVYGEEGWAVNQDSWLSLMDEGLDTFLARVTGLEHPEAERLASDLVARMHRSGQAYQTSADYLRRKVIRAVGSALVQATISVVLALVVTRAVRRRVVPARRRATLAGAGRWLGATAGSGR